jgi:hypothetical protein
MLCRQLPNPELLKQVADRGDVHEVRLKFNYRCGAKIITASEYALGEERGYEAPPGSQDGTIFFHPLAGDYGAQGVISFQQLCQTFANVLKTLTQVTSPSSIRQLRLVTA